MKVRPFLLVNALEIKKTDLPNKLEPGASAGDTHCDSPPRRDDAFAD